MEGKVWFVRVKVTVLVRAQSAEEAKAQAIVNVREAVHSAEVADKDKRFWPGLLGGWGYTYTVDDEPIEWVDA